MSEMRVPLRREQDAPRRKLRKGLFLLPSLFTAGNIAAGYYAIVQAMQGSLTEYWHFDHAAIDRKSTRLNSSHANISYAVFCVKEKMDGTSGAAQASRWRSKQ